MFVNAHLVMTFGQSENILAAIADVHIRPLSVCLIRKISKIDHKKYNYFVEIFSVNRVLAILILFLDKNFDSIKKIQRVMKHGK